MTEFSTHCRPGLVSKQSVTAVVVTLMVVLAGCSGMDLRGNESDGMPFMNHTSDGIHNGTNMGPNVTVENGSQATLHESERVTIANQTSNGTTVTIQSITVPEGGYATIHDGRRMEVGLARNIIGVSRYLTPGTHHDVTVTLFDVSGYTYGDDAHLMGTLRVFVTLHRETNAKRTFDFVTTKTSADGPYRNETGAVHVDFAVVSIEHQTTEH